MLLTSTNHVITMDRHYLWRHSITKYVKQTNDVIRLYDVIYINASQLSYIMGLNRKHRSV